ncbi:hypothetical protein A2U01_0014191, partial [Trifolium medium]|nr:hypothetical protein [Trifolium medium]
VAVVVILACFAGIRALIPFFILCPMVLVFCDWRNKVWARCPWTLWACVAVEAWTEHGF